MDIMTTWAMASRHPLACQFGLLLMAVSTASADHGSISVYSALHAAEKDLCVNDRIDLEWRLDEWDNRGLVWIEVHNVGLDLAVARFDVFQYGYDSNNDVQEFSRSLHVVEPGPKALERTHSVIYCLLNGPSKIPTIRTAQWSIYEGRSKTLVLRFSESTNRPGLDTGVAINNAITFNDGDLHLASGYGSWSDDGVELTIAGIDTASWSVLTTAISAGNFTVEPRQKLLVGSTHHREATELVNNETDAQPAELQGGLSVRLATIGELVFRLYSGERLVATTGGKVVVAVCSEELAIPAATETPGPYNICRGGSSTAHCHRHTIFAPEKTTLTPFFAVDGVLAMPGDRWLKVPHGIFPIRRPAFVRVDESVATSMPLDIPGQGSKQTSWSVGFWIFLLEEATDSHRGLFYKGNGGVMGTAPAAWLCPYTNRIALRITGSAEPGVGVDSTVTLTPRIWHHVVFSFEHRANGALSASIFVNGAIDIYVAFDNVGGLRNEEPMYFGRDPGNHGSRSFVTLIRMWDTHLSPERVATVYGDSQVLFHGGSSRALRSRFPAATAIALLTSNWKKNSRLSTDSDPRGDGTQGGTDETYELVKLRSSTYADAAAATIRCAPFAQRLEMYGIAADAGHAEGRLRYASLLLTGREESNGAGSTCGREDEASARDMADRQWRADGAKTAIAHLELAVKQECHRAAFLVAIVLLSGLTGSTKDEGVMLQTTRVAPTLQFLGVGVGAAVQDQWINTVEDVTGGATRSEEKRQGALGELHMSTTTRAIGLLHFAASGGHTEAQLALGRRYLEGHGVRRDPETAAWYLGCAADRAYAEYHVPGRQPIIEKQRLTETNEAVVAVGQQGEDDGAIQYQIHRAEQGHVPSQAALGDLYYWGTRGVARDHGRALEYFNAASEGGDNGARCAAAGMYLKGEGTVANHTKAVELYELAAKDHHVRALNGLGYEYFHGHALPRNVTLAYEYFQLAADMRQDADSLFNAGHCHATGTGTPRDLSRAAELFRLGAAWGHVDSAYELGVMSAGAAGVERNAAEAAKYFLVVAQVGPWGRGLRAAFDCYLKGDMLCALALYAETAELGYEIAASNAAFLLDRQKISVATGPFQGVVVLVKGWNSKEPFTYSERQALNDPQTDYMSSDARKGNPSVGNVRTHAWVNTMSVRWHIMAADQGHLPSYLAIGDAFFYGKGGLRRDLSAACWWYSRASSVGLARGSYNLGYMHEHGLGVPHDYDIALVYYDRASDVVTRSSDEVDQHLNGMPIQFLVFLAKARLLLNRVSGGRLARLWENDAGTTPHGSSTKNWVPNWHLPKMILETLNDIWQWVASIWTEQIVLSVGDRGHDNTANSRHRHTSSVADRVFSFGWKSDDVVLFLLCLSLIFLMLLLLRRRQSQAVS